MTFADQERNVRFINDAKKQRQWLSCELSSLDPRSENYKNDQRAICDAIGELDKVIGNAIQTPGHGGLCQMTVAPDGIPALELTVMISTCCAPAK